MKPEMVLPWLQGQSSSNTFCLINRSKSSSLKEGWSKQMTLVFGFSSWVAKLTGTKLFSYLLFPKRSIDGAGSWMSTSPRSLIGGALSACCRTLGGASSVLSCTGAMG